MKSVKKILKLTLGIFFIISIIHLCSSKDMNSKKRALSDEQYIEFELTTTTANQEVILFGCEDEILTGLTFSYNNTPNVMFVDPNVDPTGKEFNKTYTFTTAGDHIVRIYFTGSLTSAENLFKNSGAKIIKFNSFTSNQITTMESMFQGCTQLKEVSFTGFDTALVTTMKNMFKDCSNIENLDLTDFNTQSVTDMSNMFNGMTSLTSLDISTFKALTSGSREYTGIFPSTLSVGMVKFSEALITDLKNDYSELIGTKQEIDLVKTGTDSAAIIINNNFKFPGTSFVKLTINDVEQTLYESTYNINSANSNIKITFYGLLTSTNGMFYDSVVDSIKFTTFNSSLVTDMSTMFQGCLGLSKIENMNFNTEKVEAMDYMFYNCKLLTSVDLTSFNTLKVKKFAYMFYYTEKLTGITFPTNFKTSNAENMEYMFAYNKGLTNLDVSKFETQKVTSFASMFQNCEMITALNIVNFNTNLATDMSGMFKNCKQLHSLTFNFDTSKVTTMKSMFAYCENIANLDLSNFNTENVVDMAGMFEGMIALTSLVTKSFNTAKVKDMSNLFQGCYQLTSIDTSSFTTGNVENMAYMFGTTDCSELDLKGFNTAKVKDMNHMFYNSEFVNLDFSKFNTNSVTDMSSMFEKYTAGAIDLSTFRTDSVETMANMFKDAKFCELDISNFHFVKPGVDNFEDFVNSDCPATIKVYSGIATKLRNTFGAVNWITDDITKHKYYDKLDDAEPCKEECDFFIENNKCAVGCSPNYYESESIYCLRCASFCETCEDNTGCTKCEEGYGLMKDRTCEFGKEDEIKDDDNNNTRTIIIVVVVIVVVIVVAIIIFCYCRKRQQQLQAAGGAGQPITPISGPYQGNYQGNNQVQYQGQQSKNPTVYPNSNDPLTINNVGTNNNQNIIRQADDINYGTADVESAKVNLN